MFHTWLFFRHPVRGAFFSHDMTHIFSVAIEGTMISWEWILNQTLNGADQNALEEKNRGFHLQSEPPHRSTEATGTSIHRRLRARQLQNNCQFSDVPHIPTEASCSKVSGLAYPNYTFGKWVLKEKVFCNQASGAVVSHAAFHSANGLMVVGFSNGIIGLYECPGFSALYTLSVGSHPLDSVTINSDGEWLGIGSSRLGQVTLIY